MLHALQIVDQVIRSLLALSILLGIATAPAAVAVEPGTPPAHGGQVAVQAGEYAEVAVRTATGIEVLRDLGGRVPLSGPKTAKPHPLPPVPPAPAPCSLARSTSRRDLPADLRLPCGEHPPYLPTAPPLAS